MVMLPRVIRGANKSGEDAGGKPTITPRGRYAKVGKIDVLLVHGEGIDALAMMVMEPGNLPDAMKLEMAHFIGGDGRLIPCKNCVGCFFRPAGPVTSAIAQLHSDECKQAFHNARRGGTK
jgi:hypothetical protein